jgi:(5-formylfuran-3-yl)methyl phosphate synthase
VVPEDLPLHGGPSDGWLLSYSNGNASKPRLFIPEKALDDNDTDVKAPESKPKTRCKSEVRSNMKSNPTTVQTSRIVSWAPQTGLLISARTLQESKCIIEAGCKWLDLKEPFLGSLGRPSHELIFQVLELEIPESVQVSIAGGELRNWTLDLDDNLAAKLPARAYLKLALSECNGMDWQNIAKRISNALVRRSQMILVHYADAPKVNAPSWSEVLGAANSLGGKYVLMDTYSKESGGLLEHYSIDKLGEMIEVARARKLGVALAGSLKLEQLPALSRLQSDWVGVRGAVCQGTNRTGDLCPGRLRDALAIFHSPSKAGD